MPRRNPLALLPVLGLLCACGDRTAAKVAAPIAAPEERKAPHGGEILELGEEAAHLELVHDAKAGSMTVYVYGKSLDAPTAVAAPSILVAGRDGPDEIRLAAVAPGADGTASQWNVTDARLASDPLNGRIRVTIDGTRYQSRLEPAAGAK